MGTERNSHDDAIDKVLAAMRDAAPPEGMDARIAQRLHQQASAPASLSRLPARSTLAGAWWRGAISGAAFALLAIGAVLLVQHASRTTSAHPQIATGSGTAPSGTHASASPQAIRATQSRATPCARPAALRVASVTSAPAIEAAPATASLLAETRAESAAPSKPAPVMPLTAQERELVRLARTADPRQLGTLNPDTQARLEAENAAEFARFFAPPARPQPTEINPEAISEAPSQATPEASPEAKPEPNQASPEPTPDPAPSANE